MRLPENTVDAWTAIHLAQTGTQWIWLPTANQQSPRTGSSPWDLEARRGSRLLIIESKGVIGRDSITFGRNARQRRFLSSLEEAGLQLVNPKERPRHGWVLYGLPFAPYTSLIDGTSWSGFPLWHHLACPHDLELWGIPETGQRSARNITREMTQLTDHTTDPYSAAIPNGTDAPMTLAWYGHLMDQGLIGLPIPSNNSTVSFLTDLIGTARSQSEEFGYDLPVWDRSREPTPANLLVEFCSGVAVVSRHLTGIVG